MWKEWLQEHLLSLISLAALTGFGLAACKYSSVLSAYPIFVGAVLGINGVHQASARVSDYIDSKSRIRRPSPRTT